MKRLCIAVVLLIATVTACVFTHHYQHRQLNRMLENLDRIEAAVRTGDIFHATTLAEDFAATYRQVSDRISCYVSHNELRESRETAALLPTLVHHQNEEELWMELARLRAQLLYLQQVDDPLLQNIL